MSVAQEAFRDAAISAGLLLALPVGCCVLFAIKAAWKEVLAKCRGRRC